MKFWQWVWGNKVKIMGVVMAVQAQFMSMAAADQFVGIFDDITIRVIGILGSLVGVAITAAGFSNTTAVRVAEAKAEVAGAMQTAINATPPGGGN